MRRKREIRNASNSEQILKKFRKHSRSPGVGALLNAHVRRKHYSKKRRHRRCANDAQRPPVFAARSPMLNLTNHRKLPKVRNKPEIVEEKKHNGRFQEILGLAFSDPVGQNEMPFRHGDLHSEASSEGEDGINEALPGDRSPVANYVSSSSDEDSAVEEISTASKSFSRPRYITLWERRAEDVRYITSSLDAVDLLRLDPFLTTMTDRVNSLKSCLERQDGAPSSSESDCDEIFVPVTSPAPVVEKTKETFVVGAEVVASPVQSPAHSMRHTRNTHRPAHDTPSWLSRRVGERSSFTKEGKDGAFAKDIKQSQCGEKFGRRFIANLHIQSDSEDDLSTIEDADFPDQQMTEQCPARRLWKSRHSRNVFGELNAITSNVAIPPLESRSPGPEDFARLAARAFSFVTEEKKTSPNFFGVPRRVV